MNGPKHTPEPWEASGKWIVLPDGTTFAHFHGQIDCHRSVACVNACKGLSNDILEKAAQHGGQLGTTEEKLRRTWDCVNACEGGNPAAVPDLVAASQKLLDTYAYTATDDEYEAMCEMRQALAKWREGGAS